MIGRGLALKIIFAGAGFGLVVIAGVAGWVVRAKSANVSDLAPEPSYATSRRPSCSRS
jgi:hypothetical protein